MHVGDTVLGQLGELIRKRLPPGAFAARISGDRFAVLLPAAVAGRRALRRIAARRRRAAGAAPGRVAPAGPISVGVAPLDTSRRRAGARRWPPPKPPARPPRTAAATASRSTRSSDSSIVRRFADINIAAQLREALDARPAAARRAAHPAVHRQPTAQRPHFELLLRMIDDDGQTIGPDSFLSAAARYQLMPTIDRWVVKHAIEAAQAARRAAARARRSASPSTSPASRSTMTSSPTSSSSASAAAASIPTLFCFELTENATVAQPVRAPRC